MTDREKLGLPWRFHASVRGYRWPVDKDGHDVPLCHQRRLFIVKACNTHHAALDALKEIYAWTKYKDSEWAKRVHATIKAMED